MNEAICEAVEAIRTVFIWIGHWTAILKHFAEDIPNVRIVTVDDSATRVDNTQKFDNGSEPKRSSVNVDDDENGIG